ncbi:MAG TPA: ABC transporter permease [Gemmatimonadaceae bacterium]|jgi:putative ABC transport system permease protein|nr:ABC transporter permease [Gemmatimonadaceae bacterium]
MRNIKLAFRTLFKTPFVTVVAILSLALGIGANAGIYSLFHEILQRPLPVSHPEQLVNFVGPGPQYGSNSCNQAGDCDEVFSYPMLRDLQKAKTAFSGIAGHFLFGANLAMAGQTPISGEALFVTGSYFPVLGLRPAMGRLFTPDDDKTIGANYVTVLSYSYWQNQLGSDPSVVGKQLTVNGQHMTILGVAPEGFNGTTLGAEPKVFVPISMRGVMSPPFNDFERRNSYWIYLFGRLEPGATIDRATASINAVYRPIINDVEAPLQKGMSAQTMQKFRAKVIQLTDGRKGQSSAIKESRTPLTLLFSITTIVLLIACANIANLLLARGAGRSMEMAVRLSLGASRRQLVVQLLTESVLLAVLGGVVSVLVAHLTLSGMAAMIPGRELGGVSFSLSTPVLVFTALVSLGTGLLFGLAPALHSTRPDLVTELRNNSGKLSGGRGAARFRSALVTVQIALSMALLISAGLFIKSLRNVSRVDLGIRIDNLVTFGISPARSGYDSTRAKLLYQRVEDELAAIPGVTGVTTSMVALISGSNWGNSVSVEGFHKDPDTDAGSRFNRVGANYFHVLGVPLLSGRDFTVADNAGATKVAIVNETFAKKFNLGANAVGKRMSVGSDSLDIEIVGLAKDAKYSQVKDKVPPVFVLPYRQAGVVGSNNFYVRSALPAAQLMPAIRAAMRKLDPNLPLESFKTMPQQVRENVFLDRMISMLTVAFAALATLLAAVGLYGVLAYSVAQRTREIGVRMALGADAGRVRGMVLRQVGLMTIVGGLIGIGGAIGLGKMAQSLLYQLQGNDPAVIAIAVLSLAIVALAAGYVPALRASRIDPMAALRYE